MTRNNREPQARPDKLGHVEASLTNIREALMSLRYGSVAITVHEDRIVQIDVTEKRRLQADSR